MRYTSIVLLSTALAVDAFPGMLPRDEILRQHLDKREASPEGTVGALTGVLAGTTSTLGNVVGALTNTIGGLLGSVASGISPDDKRPEQDYIFQAPGPGDSRGPCPALNLLANHGYLPRNGVVNFGQILDATARGFNMGTDLATILGVFAVLTNGDLAAETFNLGLGVGSQKSIGGLNRHSTVEADVSPNREDYFSGCGDNHHLSSRLFKENVQIVANTPSKQFDFTAMGNHYANRAAFSKQNNPYLYYVPFPSIVSFVAFAFYPQFFSNGTYGLGGVANYESISSILGAKYIPEQDAFEYVPEQFPDNWYRRATPYSTVQALSEGLAYIYTKNPIAMPVAQLGTPNLNATTLLCNAYNGLNSVTPLKLASSSESVQEGLTWALSKLDPFFKDTVLGCPANSISNNLLYPNANTEGGPLSPPPSVEANTGDNVYNKIYFADAPTSPNCSPVSS